jgi:phage terminase small subunit
MVKGRKPLASAAHRASGAYAKNPSRENRHEPKATEGAPSKPAHIASNPVASGYWDHTVSILAEMKMLAKADRSVIEKYCEAMTMSRNAFECMDYVLSLKASSVAKGYMVELGLTPSARSRLVVKEPEMEDAFSQWLAGRGGGDN